MNIKPFQDLICPLDGVPLQTDGVTWACANGHSFDIARKGYTHLLPVQNKRSLDPGDHKEMVASRQRFLNAGYYRPIADAVNQWVLSYGSSDSSISCLDAGCGEGYYVRELAAASNGRELRLLGVDISKWAVLAAARQDPRPNWVVGSNANLPVQSNTLDCVLCVFGFPVYPEFARVLKPKGLLLQVDTGPDHLRELRDIIYPNQKPDRSAKKNPPAGFTQHDTGTLRYSINLNSAEPIADLLAMTPHYYRVNAQGRAKAAALTELALTIEVTISAWVKTVNLPQAYLNTH
jgi:23S rRNA (guanine745-N1)-methyltransferase